MRITDEVNLHHAYFPRAYKNTTEHFHSPNSEILAEIEVSKLNRQPPYDKKRLHIAKPGRERELLIPRTLAIQLFHRPIPSRFPQEKRGNRRRLQPHCRIHILGIMPSHSYVEGSGQSHHTFDSAQHLRF